MDRIVLNEVVKRFEDDTDESKHSVSFYLGLSDREGFRDVALETEEILKKNGADMEWWMGDQTRDQQGVIGLGAEPPNGASRQAVARALKQDYDVVMEAAFARLDRDWCIITENLGLGSVLASFGGKDIKGIMENPLEKLDVLHKVKPEMVGKLKGWAEKEMARIKTYDPHDKCLWVVVVLRKQGRTEATLAEWFQADFFFDRILKAETSRLVQKVHASLFGGG